MGTDHRGRATGNNYRPTPRFAQLMARRMPESWFDATDAQESLDRYRAARDAQKGKKMDWQGAVESTVRADAEDYKYLFDTRHEPDETWEEKWD